MLRRRLIKSQYLRIRNLVDKVELAFDKLGRVLDIQVDEFDKIMYIIRSLLDSCQERIRVLHREASSRKLEIINLIEDALKQVEGKLLLCEGANNITYFSANVMDRLQHIPTMLQVLSYTFNTNEKSILRPKEIGEMILRPKEIEDIASLLLLLGSNSKSSPISVLSIHGVPGSGKTSLVYHLYHHEKVKMHFMNYKDWVRWKDISGVRSGGEILRIIGATIGFRHLLVLEDFSNEDGEKWFDLLKPLLSALHPGSKILVTSSSTSLRPHVFHQLPLAEGAPYLLDSLHHADFLAFFQSIAFREVAKHDMNPHLRDISLEIFKMCNNNLRVIRIIALMLSSQPLSKWQYFYEIVLNIKDLAKQILSIVDLMQQYLNFVLLFPLDYEFNNVEFYQLWDAQQKFPEPFKEVCETLLGNEILFDCCRREKNGFIVYYKVRRLVHEVAKYLARGKYRLIENPTEEVYHGIIQHMSFIVDSYWKPPVWVNDARHLNSLFFLPRKSCEFITIPYMSIILENNKALQALDLAVVNCKYCLNSIGELEHLRYLRLGVSSEILPECITNLKFLQALDLRQSRVRELPVGFHKLCHLKHLYIGDGLIDLPPRFGELTLLQTLDVFIVGNNNGLDALSHFTQLAGKLKIRYKKGHEEHVIREGTPFLEGRKLHELSLEWPPSYVEAAAGKYQKEDDMEMELLQLPSTLKFLTVKNWKGERFPKWAMNQFSSLLSNLVFIHIADCSRCKHLPSFSEISCLKSLELWGLIALEWIETGDNNRLVSSETPYFPSLQHLSLVNLPQLKGWTRMEEHDANHEQDKHDNHQYVSCLILHHLYDLRVSGCTELKSMPQMPNLQSLEASNCHGDLLLHFFTAQASLVSSSSASPAVPVLQNLCSLKVSDMSIPEPLPMGFECLTTLKELSLSWLYNLRILPESIGHLNQLRRLVIQYFPNLADLPESIAALSTLEHVEIRYCPKLKQVPKYFSDLKSLQRLEIKECVNLKRRCQQPDGQDWTLIQHIPNVHLG